MAEANDRGPGSAANNLTRANAKRERLLWAAIGLLALWNLHLERELTRNGHEVQLVAKDTDGARKVANEALRHATKVPFGAR